MPDGMSRAARPLDYAKGSQAAAKRRRHARVPELDYLVKLEREKQGLGGSGKTQGRIIAFTDPEPWPSPVDGAKLLDDLVKEFKRFVVMADHERDIVALWIVHTYLLDNFLVTPRLAIRSPVKRCGKTTLLDLLGWWF